MMSSQRSVKIKLTIPSIRDVLLVLPRHHKQRPELLTQLASLYYDAAEASGSADEFDAGSKALREAVESTPITDPDFLNRLTSLLYCLSYRYDQTDTIQDINTLVEARKRAVDLLPVSNPEHLTFLHDYGRSLLSRTRRTGSKEDGAKAVVVLERVYRMTPHEHPARLQHVESLGHALDIRGAGVTAETRLQAADRLLQLRLEATSLAAVEGKVVRARSLNNLSGAYDARYQLTHSMEDLDKSMETIQECLRDLPVDDHTRGRTLANLGHALLTKFERTQERLDLDAAIRTFGEAIETQPTSDKLMKDFLQDFAYAVWVRYQATGSREDLGVIEEVMRRAIRSAPIDHPKTRSKFVDLGIIFSAVGNVTGSLWHIDMAINVFRLKAEEESSLLNYTNLLGALSTRYTKTGSEEDFTNARETGDVCLQLCKSEPTDKDIGAEALHNLASLYHTRFERSQDVEELEKAIKFRREALHQATVVGPNEGQYLKELSEGLRDRYRVTGSATDMLEALEVYTTCLSHTEIPATVRIKAAVDAGRLSWPAYPQKAFDFFSTAAKLLPVASPASFSRFDQQYALSQCNNVGSDAAALCIASGQPPELALKLLELSRGVIIGNVLNIRDDITELEAVHPELSQRFKKSRLNCDRPLNLIRRDIGAIANRYQPYEELNEVLRAIRDLKGFENFLSGLSISQMKSLAVAGPIVYVNASEFGADAFIITQQEIQHCRLPDLKHGDIDTYEVKLSSALQNDNILTRKETNAVMDTIMQWLWDAAVQPILNRLCFTETPQSPHAWPRVCWVLAGKLIRFPFHAAGYHKIPGRCTLDRVISSYTPTIRALQYARRKAHDVKSTKMEEGEELMLGIMDETVEQQPLLFADQEALNIDQALPPSVKRVSIRRPRKADVLEHIRTASMVHFACHGELSAIDPSQSKILLSDWKEDPLSVADVTDIKLDRARFAYLSACHVASHQDQTLQDEAIHMAGAFQLAGFPTVIGTLWHASDKYCAEVAKRVYEGLVTVDGEIDFDQASSGLHFALHFLRASRVSAVVWAPFVHIGI